MYKMGAQFVQHNGCEILFLNFQGLNSNELTEYAKKANDFISASPEKV